MVPRFNTDTSVIGNRSLCTQLGAAQKFTLEYLKRPEIHKLIENSTIIYQECYFFDARNELGTLSSSVCSCYKQGFVFLYRMVLHLIAKTAVFCQSFRTPFSLEISPKGLIQFYNMPTLLLAMKRKLWLLRKFTSGM